MRRVILLLPTPDLLQIANCHKYVTRTSKTYSAIYTLTTIKGQCADVDKILVIGHGHPGGFDTATPDQVATAILESGMDLKAGHKVAFDTCYSATNIPHSALDAVENAILAKEKEALIFFHGTTGPSITIGAIDDKRLVVNDAQLGQAGDLQNKLTDKHGVDLFAQSKDWRDGLPSDTIKVLAQRYYSQLKDFAIEFRSEVDEFLDKSSSRKDWV